MRKDWLLAPAVLLVLAIVRLPYGYYEFLRYAVSISALIAFIQSFGDSRSNGALRLWQAAIVVVGVAFNPLSPLYLHRGTWAFIDLAAAAVFFYRWNSLKE